MDPDSAKFSTVTGRKAAIAALELFFGYINHEIKTT